MMLLGHAATRWAIGHKTHAAAGGKFVALPCLRKTPRPPQCRSMYMRQNYPPGDAPGKEFNTENLVAHPAPKPSATKSFQKIVSAGIGARKVSSY